MYTAPAPLKTTGMPSALVVERVLGISQIKDDTGVGLSTTTVLKLLAKVNSPVEAQAAILVDINV